MSKNVCVGCLSHDRELTLLAEEHEHLWRLIMERSFSISEPLSLCWECHSFVHKLHRFKQNVARATETLSNYFLQQSEKPTQCLSRLSISITELISTENKTEKTLRNYRTTEKRVEDFENDFKTTGHFQIRFRTFSSSSTSVDFTKNCVLKKKKSEEVDSKCKQPNPLFVKVENCSASDGDGVDDDFFDDESKSVAEKVLFEVDVEPNGSCEDGIPPRVSNEGFNDSDEEPLYRKQKTTTTTTEQCKQGKKRLKKGKAAKKSRSQGGVVTNKKAMKKLQQLNVEEGMLEIVELSWDQVEEERQRARDSEAFQRLQYKCHECIVGFNHRSKLDNHMTKHDSSFGNTCCDICHVRCRGERALQAHLRRHRVRWRCVRCGSCWSRAAVAADHVTRSHGARAPLHRCRRDDCHHVAASLAGLRLHMKSHLSRVACDLCDKSFRDRASLRTHLFIHQGVKEFACPTCDKRFLFKKAMEVHAVTHDAPAHLYCHECDVTFKNRMSYYGHMKYNLKHIDPAKLKHECKECGKRFAKAVRLKEHRAAIHLHLTPEHCDHPGCGFACASRPVLRAHRRSTHGGVTPKRDHVCHTCGKAYTTKTSLEGHLRAHLGSRPLRCALCPAAFSYDAALYNHTKRVHKIQRATAFPAQSAE